MQLEGLPLAGTVQVHCMDMREAVVDKTLHHIYRVGAVGSLRVIVAACQAHALAPDDVYGRNYINHSSRKLRNIRSPVSPLFSGWNCVA